MTVSLAEPRIRVRSSQKYTAGGLWVQGRGEIGVMFAVSHTQGPSNTQPQCLP